MLNYSIVVESRDYDVDGLKKTFETVCQVKQTRTNMGDHKNHYSIENYDTSLLDKIYKDGEYYAAAADVPE